MTQLTIRRLDESTIARLKARAAARGHSMEQEAREILKREVDVDWEAVKRRLDAWRKLAFGDRVLSDSTEIIREMRDQRMSDI